jgi:endonuclease/exonuclease/phosphatase family metal-dependent hydrolase
VSEVVPRIKKPRLRNAAGEPNGIGVDKPTYNFWHPSTFDYILISPDLQVLHMHTEEFGKKAPNADQGSDHFPVTAELLVTTSHQEMKLNF